MPDRASGFCIYDDPALAIARARHDGLRVLYLDFDVHHGDGVQAIHADDPGVLTLSLHETGRYLFPGTGDADEIGEGTAAGTVVNVPFEPFSGADPWLDAIRRLVPELAAAFGPDLIVSQHGADSHAWDPLAHLRMTTSAMPRRRDWWTRSPIGTPAAGGSRPAVVATTRTASCRGCGAWSGSPGRTRTFPSRRPRRGARAGPTRRAGIARPRCPRRSSIRRTRACPSTTPRPRPRRCPSRWSTSSGVSSCPGSCAKRGHAAGGTRWPSTRRRPTAGATGGPAGETPGGPVTVVTDMDPTTWSTLSLAPRVIAPFDAATAHAIVAAALAQGASVAAAVAGSMVVGLAVTGPDDALLALGVAPGHRRAGLATALLSSRQRPERRADGRGTRSRGSVAAYRPRAGRSPDPGGGRVHGVGRHPTESGAWIRFALAATRD